MIFANLLHLSYNMWGDWENPKVKGKYWNARPYLRFDEKLWNDLEAFVPRQSARDSAMIAGLKFTIPRAHKQPQLPLTLHLDERGGVRADTTLAVGGRTVHLVLQRVDTLSFKRPF